MWFRRDLRLADNPALLSAVADAAGDPAGLAAEVVPLFVLDPALSRPAGAVRRAYLAASLADLGSRVGGLQVRRGDPAAEVVAVARAARASTVHVTEDFGPAGRRRDLDVESELARHGIALVRTGSPYAVPPGMVRTGAGGPYQVFTPYSRAWRDHGWPGPVMPPLKVSWSRPMESHQLEAVPLPARVRVVAIAGRARAAVGDGFAAAADPVEERGLADIGPADEGDSREGDHGSWGAAGGLTAETSKVHTNRYLGGGPSP